jgi:hypothetical protein
MRDSAGIRLIVEELEYMRAKRAQVANARPRLVVVHGHHQAAKNCLPGETIEQVYIAVQSRAFPLRLSLTGLVIADVLAQKKPMLLSAAHIQRILSSDPFYVRLGTNAASTPRPSFRPARKSIKVYVQRLRVQLGKALKEAGLDMRPEDVVVAEATDLLNVVVYRLDISCEFVHLGATVGMR